MADESPVLLERAAGGRVALVTLNRPAVMNALSTAMALRLVEVLDEVLADARVRAVVLTGAGDRAFCAGADLKERRGMTPEQWTAQHRIFEGVFRRLRTLRKPVLAAVNGAAMGGGCEMAMSTDFIVAAQTARFGLPEVSRGIMPGGGGTQLLPRLLPLGPALRMLTTAEPIDAAEAHRCGLVTSVHPPAELRDAALRIAARIAANSPAAVEQARRSVRLGAGLPVEQAILVELECYRRMVDHPDRHEGVNAFNEGRAPEFEDAP